MTPFDQKSSSYLISASGLILAATLLAAGCSSSDDTSSGETPVVPAEDLSETDNEQIRQSAADTALQSLNMSVSNAAQLSDDPIPVLDSPTLDPITGENITGVSSNQAGASQLTTESNSFLHTSLGLDENSQAVVTQNGNQITIDPSDEDICTEEIAGDVEEQQEYEICVALAADLIIEINAQTEEVGVISYFFQGVPIITINYAPTESSYDLNFTGLQTYQSAYTELYNQQIILENQQLENPAFAQELLAAPTMSGIIRASTSFDPENSEAGKVAIDIVEHVQYQYSESYYTQDFSLDTGTLLSVETSAGSGNGIIEMDIGALSNKSTFVYNSPYEDTPSIVEDTSEISMPGLTGRMELTKEGSELKVSNLGLARGPLTITVNSVEQFRTTLEAMGFSLNESNGELILDTDLNFSQYSRIETISYSTEVVTPAPTTDPAPVEVTAENEGYDESVEVRQLNLSAVAGTGLLSQIASTKITQGGPFSISLQTTVDDAAPSNTSLTVEAGQCVGDDGDDSNGELDIVTCDGE